REDAILHDKRTGIKRDVLDSRRGRPGAVIQKHDGIVDVHLGGVAAHVHPAAELEIDVSQPALPACVNKIEAAPIASTGHAADPDACGWRSLRENLPGAADGDRYSRGDIDRRAGLNREHSAVADGQVAGDA